MVTNSRGQSIIAGTGEPVTRARINGLLDGIYDIRPVANATARAQLVADLTDDGFPPSSTRPLYVHRADAPATSKLQYTEDGTTWRTPGGGGGLLIPLGGSSGTSVGPGVVSRLPLGTAVRDTPGWSNGGITATVPYDCLLNFTYQLTAGTTITARFFAEIEIGSKLFRQSGSNDREIVVSGQYPVAAGTSVSVYGFHTSPGTVHVFTGALTLVGTPLPEGW